jgi:hypothetical protein
MCYNISIVDTIWANAITVGIQELKQQASVLVRQVRSEGGPVQLPITVKL